jgi:hypothetical protein
MAIWQLVGRRLSVPPIFMVLIVLLTQGGVIVWAERYLLAAGLALSYAAIHRNMPVLASGRPWFWILCGLALWADVVQFVYAAPVVVYAYLHDEFWSAEPSLQRRMRRAAQDLVVPAAAFTCFVIFLAYRGELDGFVETSRQSAAQAIYAVLPTQLQESSRNIVSVNSIGVFALFVLLFLGAAAGRQKCIRRGGNSIGIGALCPSAMFLLTS